MGLLSGKVAIVTGGGRGIGRSHALALAAAGAAVVVNDLGCEFSGDGGRDIGPAEEVARLIEAGGGRAIADAADISDWDAVGETVRKTVDTFGRLDIVVNNAAITRFGTIDAISRKDWESTIGVNLTGTAALSHWAARHWRAAGPEAGRRIINTSSGVGLTPLPGNPMYVATKAAVAAITVSSAIELAELGVRANALAPAARSRISEFVAPDQMAQVTDGFDRMSPDHIATVALYLASPLCQFTGRVVGVIGDSITLYEGWTVPHHLSNGDQGWTLDGLHAALADLPAQQQGSMQALNGTTPLRTPSDQVLEQLRAIEAAAG